MFPFDDVIMCLFCYFNTSPPSAAYMRQWTGPAPALVQVMACRLFGAKPLPEPMLAFCQLDSWEQISVKFESEFYNFDSRKCIWKCRLPEWLPFCPGGDELNSTANPYINYAEYQCVCHRVALYLYFSMKSDIHLNICVIEYPPFIGNYRGVLL